MNQQQLDQIKARAQAARYEGSPSIEKVKAMALFRHNAVGDVLALVAEVERLRVIVKGIVTEFHKEGFGLSVVNGIYELEEILGEE